MEPAQSLRRIRAGRDYTPARVNRHFVLHNAGRASQKKQLLRKVGGFCLGLVKIGRTITGETNR